MTRQELDALAPSRPRSSPPTRIVIDLATVDLRVGDEVVARNDDGEYEVGAVEALQGRVQVADTRGNVHSYHEGETLTVVRLE